MKTKIVLPFIAVLILALALSSCSVVNEITSISDAGNAFMTALKDGDHAASWDMLAVNVQEEIGSPEAWAEWASIRNFPEWKFTNTEFENTTGQMDGEATLDGVTYTVTLIFDKVDDAWKVSGILFE
jgi:hypothetical protein